MFFICLTIFLQLVMQSLPPINKANVEFSLMTKEFPGISRVFFSYPVYFVGDFFLLLFVCLQWQVFRTEAHVHSDASLSYGGGSNADILEEVEANMPIPVEDFTTIHE